MKTDLVEIPTRKPQQKELFNANTLLKNYVTTREHETEWHYECNLCHKKWRLSKESDLPGNKAFLENHVREHLNKAKPILEKLTQ